MATINGIMSVHINDQYGITGTVPTVISVDDTKTIAQLMTDVVDYENAVLAITDGNVVKSTVSLEHPAAGSDPAAAVGDIEKGALYNFNNATDIYATGILVPDLAASTLTGAGLIDLSNVNVAAFVTFMTTAHTAITLVTKGIRALTSLRDALIAFRKHRKPLSRKTKET